MSENPTVLAAVFADPSSAAATREALGDEHYRFRWLATTKPDDRSDDGEDALAGEPHVLRQSSDGAVGAVGRFLSGAGGSLSRALRDHGVSEGDADAIDRAVPAHGAVLVVHAPADRVAEASTLLERGGGRLFHGDDTALVDAPGSLTPLEADHRGLVPDYDKSVSVGTTGSADAVGATNVVGRYDAATAASAGPPAGSDEVFFERRMRSAAALAPPPVTDGTAGR